MTMMPIIIMITMQTKMLRPIADADAGAGAGAAVAATTSLSQ